MALPAGLRDRGQHLLTLSHPLRSDGGANRISYMLPFWMREMTNSPIGMCRDLAVGNIYAMLRYFLLDDVMDGKERSPAGIRASLALGQLLEELFRQRYQRHLPQNMMVWDCYRRYVGEWTTAVYTEMADPIDPNDIGHLAWKAAPVKIGAVGLLVHAGMEERIQEVEQAVEFALAALQLSDDWDDWQEDLPCPNGNAFLSVVRARLRLTSGEALDERTVRTAIYHHEAVDTLADIAEGYVERLKQIPHRPDGLAAFAAAIAEEIRAAARKVQVNRVSLATEGGFSRLMSKFDNL